MSLSSSFLFYPEAFLAGTQTLSYEDRGKYITILCAMHQQECITEEDIVALVGTLSEALKQKFTVDKQGYWHNRRLEYETQKRNKVISSRQKNGAKGGRPVKSDQASPAILPAEQSPMDVVFCQWVQYRKSIHKPLKELSLEAAFKRLKELSGNDAGRAEAIVHFSISNGYQGLFPLKENNYKQIKTTTEQWLA